jgi:phosphoribosyl 1,2-cyclic phosphodiesterase
VRLTLLGVRGSTPAPGADFVAVGGNTSCVVVGPDQGPPRLVLDAGTGLRRLTAELGGAPFRGTILLTHLHWDHLQGLPFFAAGDRDDAQVRLLLPAQGDPVEVLGRALSPPHFPIGPGGLRGAWTFEGLAPGCQVIEGLAVTAAEVAHKGGLTFGYRVDDGHHAVAYLPDHALVDPVAARPDPGGRVANAVALARGADVLIHDAQFVAEERTVAVAYGHATVEAAVDLARHAQVRRLVLFHHGPDRTDRQVAAIAEQARRQAASGDLEIVVATEDTVIDLPDSEADE